MKQKKMQTTPALESSYPNRAKDATSLSISIVTAFRWLKCSNYLGIKWCTGSERAVLLYFVIENEYSHLKYKPRFSFLEINVRLYL